MNEQLYILLKKLVVKNQIHLNQNELQFQLESHPSYPSLHSVTGVLDHFSVPNLAVKLPHSSEVFEQLPSCVLAVINNELGEQIVLVEKRKNKILLTFNQGKKQRISKESFLAQWTGVVIAIEKDETQSEPKKGHSAKRLAWIIIAVCAIILGSFITTFSSIFPIAHFLLSGIGLILSVFIIKHELGWSSTLTSNFCNISEKTNCEAVLDSNGALILGTFKLSDLSLVAFSGYTLSWILFLISGDYNIFYVQWLSILAMPVVGYSIYQQAMIVKKWCPLCLGISGVLLLQFAFIFTHPLWSQIQLLDGKSMLFLTVSTVTPGIIWSYLKPLLANRKEFKILQITHAKFKRNFSIFQSLYNQAKALKFDPSIQNELVFGNEKAALKLVVVTSPFCIYCKKAHRDLHELLRVGKENICLKIRFRVNVSDKDSKLYRVVTEILHTYHSKGQAACLLLLDKLYDEQANVTQWIDLQNCHRQPVYDEVMAQQANWCNDNQINFTPALYVNGRELPNEYNRMDLRHFIDDFIALDDQDTPSNIPSLVAS